MSLKRPCIDCGQPAANTRCPACARPVERQRHDRRYDSGAWARTRLLVLSEHRRNFGSWCPGAEDHEGHPSSDLTVDHIIPIKQGGSLLDRRNLRVTCRQFNSSRASRVA